MLLNFDEPLLYVYSTMRACNHYLPLASPASYLHSGLCIIKYGKSVLAIGFLQAGGACHLFI